MSHRARSRTADSAESKKAKGTPRRLTEKIAIMKRREHEQSEAFEKAMKSIFEVCVLSSEGYCTAVGVCMLVCVCVCVCVCVSVSVRRPLKRR